MGPLFAATQPRHYVDTEIFASEREGFLSRSWMFAGLKRDIPAPNDYFLVDVAGRNVIVQNCGGAVAAFINSCSHRHARIHEMPRGNRGLICPYHGWTYDGRGVPVGIPGKSNFPQVVERPEHFALRSLEVDCAGDFIFVRLEPGGPGLKEFLGRAWDFLARVSAGLDERLDEFRERIDANWKIVIENALEGYHVPAVHRATLASIRQFSTAEEDITDHLPEDSGHSYMINRADPAWLERWRKYEKDLGTWPFMFDHYIHQLVFPNLTVTSFMGYSFHIQRFDPQSTGRTDVVSAVYSVRCKGQTPRGARIMQAVYKEGVEFTRRVFAEDKRVCELAFLGVREGERSAVLASNYEKRIAHFQRHYLRVMGASAG